jgi:hypothetical protein
MSEDVIVIDTTQGNPPSPEVIEIAASSTIGSSSTGRVRKRQKRNRLSSDGIEIIEEIRRPTKPDTGVELVCVRTVRRPRPLLHMQHFIPPTITKPSHSLIKLPPAPPEPPLQPAMLKCTVCLELASETTQLCSTVCGHIFCLECLQNALKVDKKCPNCRKKLSKNQYHRIYLSV